MKKFMLFITGLIALIILVVNLGPMILLGVSIWLLYIIFKQFMRTSSTVGKIGWAVAGIFTLCLSVSNIFSVIGIAAVIVLYLIIKSWKKDDGDPNPQVIDADDPFTNFERQWSELNS